MSILSLQHLRGLTAVLALVPGFIAAVSASALAESPPGPAVQQAEPVNATASETAPAEITPTETTPVGRATGVLTLPDGQRIRYQTTAESLPIVDRAGKTTAEIFVASFAAEAKDNATRPVTFLFNGGPGAASAFLMLGAAGPKALVTNADGTVPRPPARLEDNPASWLAFTDLVFVDPVGTGFSRATGDKPDADRRFWGVDSDVDALSEVVRLWLTRNSRWASPKFLAGESYGAFRVVLMAEALQREEGVDVSGLALVSPALELSMTGGAAYDVMPWALRLPSIAAAAQAQGKASPAPSAEVERFALTDYMLALSALDRTGDAASAAAHRRIAALTGMPEDLVRRHDGRIPRELFAKELLRDQQRVLSIYDASVAGPDPNPDETRLGPDPMLDGLIAPYATAFNAYVRNELGYESDVPYRLLNRKVSRSWTWDGENGGSRSDAGVMEALESIMALNPSMRVLVAHGAYDLVTPYFASTWLIDRMRLPAEVKANARLRLYEGGHMMYMRPDARAKLAEDLEALYESALAGT